MMTTPYEYDDDVTEVSSRNLFSAMDAKLLPNRAPHK